MTLLRVQQETGVPVTTLSDWRTGHHAPRDADRFLDVVRLLCHWAELPSPNVREWIQLVETTSGTGASKSAPATPDSAQWTTSIVGLGDRLSIGFSASHVEVDALCLTGQSLALAAARPVQDIHAGKIRPARVSVRVLVPSRDIALAFPVSVKADDADGDLLHQRWLMRRNTHAQSLRTALLSLRSTHDIDVDVAFRAVPFTPMAELYLINGSEALFSYCMATRREEVIDDQPQDFFDAMTELSLQRRFTSDATESTDTTFVEQSHLWFNSIWETVSTDVQYNL
ncbi:GntR family transcriptional regulator [Streptomyces sp. NBC_00457]|uniref:GntR family transcriptional regulator n=1 Tax=unclassified Streptomyces TaxID=2593676 RepID=UPI002E1C81E3|nr:MULTISPECIES: GntR family transcriptional regulator [unclassified Streptomyces]